MPATRRTCATMPHHFHLAARDPAYVARRLRIEGLVRVARLAAPPGPLRIPVVVHLLGPDEAALPDRAEVDSQIAVLNEDFRARNEDLARVPAAFRALAGDAGIEFELARVDPAGQPTEGITRTLTAATFAFDGSAGATARLDALLKFAPTGAPAWPREDYLNLWIAPLGNGLLGYAQFPGGPAETDGVVVHRDAFGRGGRAVAPFDRGRTCTHEVGHWLNLLHIWGDDGGGCTHSDNVDDTPNQGGPNYGAPEYPRPSCGNGPDGDMFMNFMDYVDDAAMQLFSAGQVERMRAALAGPRATLAASAGLGPPEAAPMPMRERATGRLALLDAPIPQVERRFNGVDWR